ncbi:MAG: sensor histidine kinase [Syntrophobacteraceae bacterium]
MLPGKQDMKLVQEFIEDLGPLVRARVNVLLYFGILLVPLFGVVDYIMYPRLFRAFMTYRVLTSAFCGILFVVNRKWNLGYKSFYLALIEFYVIGCVLTRMITVAGGYTSPYYAGLSLEFLLFCSVLTIDVKHLAFHSAVLYLIYIGSVFFSETVPSGQAIRLFLTNNMFVISTIAGMLIASKVDYRLRWEEFVLQKELKERSEELEAAQEELIRKERLAVLGQLIATVSHELRNPLGTIRSSVFSLGEKLRDRGLGVERILDRADRNVLRCDRIIEELLDYTRTRNPILETTALDQWLEEFLRETAIPEGIILRKDLRSGTKARLDREWLRRCLQNVIDNACQAMLEKMRGRPLTTPVEHTLTVSSRLANDRIEIRIVDTGTGISEEELSKIFTPLYSTRGFGVGLGLPIVNQLMQSHRGGVQISSEPGCGTTVTLWLPADSPRASLSGRITEPD